MTGTGICPGCGQRIRRLGGKGKSSFISHTNKQRVRCTQRKPGGGPVTGEQVYKWELYT